MSKYHQYQKAHRLYTAFARLLVIPATVISVLKNRDMFFETRTRACCSRTCARAPKADDSFLTSHQAIVFVMI